MDPRRAVSRAIVDDGAYVEVCGERVDVSSTPVFAIGLGKAAASMALGVQDVIGHTLTRGLISAPASSEPLSEKWHIYNGGHPLPNEESLEAGAEALNLLDWANDARGFVIFLVSGGGSAMMEYAPLISLDELRHINEQLVTSGARISEINAVRRTYSGIKGGKLAEYASNARIVTLIVSDTNPGDEANVASGPTLSPSINSPYKVLLDNSTALEAAQQKASELGFASTIAHHICEQSIEEGCDLLLRESAECVISGGEFSCPVRGDGIGGRKLETVLCLPFRMPDGSVAL